MVRWPLDNLERRAIDAVRQHARDGRLPGSARTLGLDADEYNALCKVLTIGYQQSEGLGQDENRVAVATTTNRFVMVTSGVRSSCNSGNGWNDRKCMFWRAALWQDIGLAGRPEVSTLLDRHFNKLATENTRGLKWKRYLFLRLGESLAISDLRPPRCANCDQFPVCFPPQAADGVTVTRSSHGQNSQPN